MSIFSTRLQQLREHKGWSKSDTARRLKVSPQRYSNWEYGIREPDFEMLNNIAKFFNTTTDYLTGKTDDLKSTPVNSKNEIVDIKDDPVILAYDGTVATEDDMDIIKSIIARHKRDNENG